MAAAGGAVGLKILLPRRPQPLSLIQHILHRCRAQGPQKFQRCITVIFSSARRVRAGMHPALRFRQTTVDGCHANLLLALCSMRCSGVTRQCSARRDRQAVHGHSNERGSTGTNLSDEDCVFNEILGQTLHEKCAVGD